MTRLCAGFRRRPRDRRRKRETMARRVEGPPRPRLRLVIRFPTYSLSALRPVRTAYEAAQVALLNHFSAAIPRVESSSSIARRRIVHRLVAADVVFFSFNRFVRDHTTHTVGR